MVVSGERGARCARSTFWLVEGIITAARPSERRPSGDCSSSEGKESAALTLFARSTRSRTKAGSSPRAAPAADASASASGDGAECARLAGRGSFAGWACGGGGTAKLWDLVLGRMERGVWTVGGPWRLLKAMRRRVAAAGTAPSPGAASAGGGASTLRRAGPGRAQKSTRLRAGLSVDVLTALGERAVERGCTGRGGGTVCGAPMTDQKTAGSIPAISSSVDRESTSGVSGGAGGGESGRGDAGPGGGSTGYGGGSGLSSGGDGARGC